MPQDRSGANTQAAPVGRRMCGILYPGCRFALPWAKRLLPFQGAYLAGLTTGRVFILVYRLAMDARPERVMVWLAENIQACLRIFRRAQHQWLARDILHQAQGVFYVFVLWPG